MSAGDPRGDLEERLLPDTSDEATPQLIRIFSVNVWCHIFAAIRSLLPLFARPSAPGLMPMVPLAPRLSAIADVLGDGAGDIVIVQELFILRVGPFVLSSLYLLFASRMAALGLVHRSNPRDSLPRFFGQNSGLAIFSRWPLDDARSVGFAHTRERLNRKGVVHAVVRLPGNAPSLAVAATHLDKRRSAAKAAQIAQVGALARSALLVLSAAQRPRALVLCGDFNIAPPAQSCHAGEDDGDQSDWAALVRAISGESAGEALPDPDEHPAELSAINGWDPARADGSCPGSAWPPTHDSLTVDHAWLLSASADGESAGGTAPRFCGACEALRVRDAASGLSATDHAAVLVTINVSPGPGPGSSTS